MFSSSAIEKLKSKKIYALEGNIGAGKTTIMKIISNHFNDVEFVEEPVSQWQNLGGMNLLDAFFFVKVVDCQKKTFAIYIFTTR